MIEIFMIAQCISYGSPQFAKANGCWLPRNEKTYATAELCKRRLAQLPDETVNGDRAYFRCVSKLTPTLNPVD